MRCATRRRATRARPGFTLLELVVTISVIAILAGMALPLASITINSAARSSTNGEFETLSLAIGEYFRDTWDLPGTLTDLNVDPGVAGWAGPYVVDATTEIKSGSPQYTVDGWSEPYEVTVAASAITLVSKGSDRAAGTADDLEYVIDVTPLRRDETRRRLRTLNQAITLYNGSWQELDPLPANLASLLSKLVARGYLPSSAGYEQDGWGVAFEECPRGLLPVVEVISTSMGDC